ncbi:cornifelin-like [Channa argus]|uniref:cornifelin-like n=1 Tax=Channa argus TaxID=215402 RepID=UPI00351F9F9F
MTTNVFVNQPPPTTTLIAVQPNQWSTGICDCFDDLNVCCFAFWCFPCFACHTTAEFGECCCLPLLDSVGVAAQLFGFPVLIPPVSMSMRVAVRFRYKIPGDMGNDCVYATFCNTCSWCQMAREIKRRKTTITAQAVQIGSQQLQLVNQSGIVCAQPVIPTAPQGIVTATLM